MDIDIEQLPIPDWGLECPGCHYPLRGLPAHRCPECGRDLVMTELVKPWHRVRPPRITGAELPIPGYWNAKCKRCQAPLAGASRHACGLCGEAFDPQDLRPSKPWFILDSFLCGPLPIPGVHALLEQEHVPHFEVQDDALRKVYGTPSMTVTQLRVASEFYFEVLWLLDKARREFDAARQMGAQHEWPCTHCQESNPGHFEVCWNCGEPRTA